MHGLTLATLPAGATARPLADGHAGRRTVEALAPAALRAPAVAELLDRLAQAAAAYAPRSHGGPRRASGRAAGTAGG
jgi:hypothetical protein